MPLQKSFSEQNHSANKQHRPQWQRNKSYQGPQGYGDNRNPPPLSDKPPLPVSSKTKNKLSMYQFEGPQPKETMSKGAMEVVDMADKENAIADRQARSQQNLQSDAEFVSLSGDVDYIDAPMTPAGRLTLPELFGMADAQADAPETYLDEHVGWNHSAIPSSDASHQGTKRSRKARSVSPFSSPAHHAAHFDRKGNPLDLKKLNLKSPQNDPGSELWDSYSLNSEKPTPQGPPNPALANLMYTSSPQGTTKGMGRFENALRRSNSCGTQWPKRRKVGGEIAGSDVFSGPMNVGPSKLKLVSALLEKVQEGYTSSANSRIPNVPSSSLPVPQGKYPLKHKESSPPRPSTQVDSNRLLNETFSCTEDPPPLVDVVNLVRCEQSVNSPESPDYGYVSDDCFTESLAGILEGNPLMLDLSPCSLAPKEPFEAPVRVHKIPTSMEEEEEEDEFDDLGDDILDADLENIVATYDTRAISHQMNHDKPGRSEAEEKLSAYKSLKTESEEEFGNDIDDSDFEIAEAIATQSLLKPHTITLLPSTQKPRAIQRYLVTAIVDSQYENQKGQVRPQKVLFVHVENTKDDKVIILRDGWVETPVSEKSFVHVIGEFDSQQCIVDDAKNMVILHPDHLISSTVVADSFSCTRRAVLQDRVKATSDSAAPLVYGTILHEIFQAAMMANRWDSEWFSELIEVVATRHLEDLYTIKIQIPQAVEYLQSKMGELQSWAEIFISSQPQPQAIVKAGNGETANMCISKLLDVEEHVWSPMYGLKGNIDATIQVTMQDGKVNRTLTVPFEVKTGQTANASHRAQTALYNLLLSDRYDIEIAFGILYYMETSETIRIPAIRHEVRHMIMQRNELACFVRERHAQLPPMLRKENLCNRCYAKVPCFIYHRLADDGDGETSGMREKFNEVVKHLTPKHKEFFLKWDNLLTKEEKESLKFRRELWTMLSSEREKLGRCFSNVIIEPESAFEEQNNPKINRFRYTLIKQEAPAGFSFLESQIIVGEPIVISDEKGHFALANGYVTHVRKNRITVAVDRRLHNARIRRPGFDEANNQVFTSIMNVASEGLTPNAVEDKIDEPPVLYRLDKDEFSNGMATVRNNIIQVMAEGPFGSREIRSLVVDLKPPQFKPHSTAYTLTDRASINIDQRRAIEKVMSARDYALVLGMPGTGKTTTIAHIIRALVSQGKSVLLTSYTHTAVDNILLKLSHANIPILRLGSVAKIHPGVQEFANLAAKPKATFEELRSSWHDSPVVATTCLGINHPIFNERTFDYCIVDEASQITLPVCLGPIRMARTFILVGDHNQLPPLVQNEEARTGGLDISLFKHLSDMHPSSVVNLEHQYRMCEDIMALSNNLIYNGRLKCGTPEIAARSIIIPNMDDLRHIHHTPATLSRSTGTICPGPVKGSCWIRDLLDPSTKVSFINTDTLLPGSREEAKGNRIVNPTEATICVQLVESLLGVGVPASAIGVMTHYRSQLSLLRHSLRGHSDVEMHTADRFQGRDKEVVILSLVRSNEAKSIGELLKDWRRINVAFTRAKTKLLVIGSRETLKGNGSEEMVAKFVGLMEERGWVYNFPVRGLESHVFDATMTQTTASTSSRPSGAQWKSDGSRNNRRDRSPPEDTGKENQKPEPKRAKISERALFAGKPVLRDIVNDAGYSFV